MRHFLVLFVVFLTCYSSEDVNAAEKTRVVFNDDAQFLFEMQNIEDPVAFVKGWLDREMEAIPFNTFVFLAATPDICTYETKAGEVYGDRHLPEGNTGWAPGIRALRTAGTDALRLVTEHMKANGKEVLLRFGLVTLITEI